MVSPLDILAKAVASVSWEGESNLMRLSLAGSPLYQAQDQASSINPVDQRLVGYFAPQTTFQRDWQVLAAQPVESIFKLESTACDPVAARLIDKEDAYLFFNLFFATRNPILGLLDLVLHTPQYVYSVSFTLFSVICALGCALSARPRDRVIYAALLSLAEGNMQWSIAVSVRCPETIQAIVLMQYWAPVRSKRSEDPYWLYLSHAAQLGREIGIHRPESINEHLNATVPGTSQESKERLRRNLERTWLYIFVADKSFGIVTGRRPCVSWNEMPPAAFDWWRKPFTTPHDRMISGIVESRGILLDAFRRRNSEPETLSSISQWHMQSFETLEHVRGVRCAPDASPSGRCLSLLAFYMDHIILVLNAQAMRDITTYKDDSKSPELDTISRKAVIVASRVLDSVLTDPLLQELKLGLPNNHFIMICHALAEIFQAVKRNILSPGEVSQVTLKARAIPEYMDSISQLLPTSSAARLYASLSRCFVTQLDKLVTGASLQNEPGIDNLDTSSGDWWKPGDEDWLDVDINMFPDSLSLEQLVLNASSNSPITTGGYFNDFLSPENRY